MATWTQYIEFIQSKGNIQDVMIISTETGGLWAGTTDFVLREYKATIVQEDGSEVEELVNEADNVLKFMKGEKPHQGLRINGGKKQQILRSFKDEVTECPIIYGKITKGGCCIASAGKCILIGTFDETANHTSVGCNEVITLMARYLQKSEWPTDASQLGGNSATWLPYLENMLINKGNVGSALICSKDDGTHWASVPSSFTLKTYEADIAQEDGTDVKETVNEAQNLIQFMKGGPKPKQGLRINEVKYQLLRSFVDDDAGSFTVYGKKGQGGCCIMISETAVIVAVFDESQGHTSAGCNTACSDLVKYLKSINI